MQNKKKENTFIDSYYEKTWQNIVRTLVTYGFMREMKYRLFAIVRQRKKKLEDSSNKNSFHHRSSKRGILI